TAARAGDVRRGGVVVRDPPPRPAAPARALRRGVRRVAERWKFRECRARRLALSGTSQPIPPCSGANPRTGRPIHPACSRFRAPDLAECNRIRKCRVLLEVAGAGGCWRRQAGMITRPRRPTVSVIDFFEYLAAHDQTRELAGDLADAWAEHARDISV